MRLYWNCRRDGRKRGVFMNQTRVYFKFVRSTWQRFTHHRSQTRSFHVDLFEHGVNLFKFIIKLPQYKRYFFLCFISPLKVYTASSPGTRVFYLPQSRNIIKLLIVLITSLCSILKLNHGSYPYRSSDKIFFYKRKYTWIITPSTSKKQKLSKKNPCISSLVWSQTILLY